MDERRAVPVASTSAKIQGIGDCRSASRQCAASAKLARGGAEVPLNGDREARCAIVADCIGNLRDRGVPLVEKLQRLLHPPTMNIVEHGLDKRSEELV